MMLVLPCLLLGLHALHGNGDLHRKVDILTVDHKISTFLMSADISFLKLVIKN